MKIPELQSILRAKNIPVAILDANDSMLRYLLGGEIAPEYGFLVIPAKKEAVFYTAGFEVSRFKKVTAVNVKKMEKSSLKPYGNTTKVGINEQSMSVAQSKKFKGKKVDISSVLVLLRQQKTSKEITRIKQACKITDEIFEAVFRRISKWKTEGQVKEFMERAAKDASCTLAFDTIVGSGKHGALPHYNGSDKLRKGFCVIDFGVKYKGYCSDVTRTVFLGKPAKKDKEMYDLVLNAQVASIQALKPGIAAKKIDAIARKELGKYQKYFIHGLGHQVGVDVHDSGLPLGPSSKGDLMENMVLTVEPGVYFTGKYGIRIEDDVLIKNTPQVLSNVSKDLVIISK